MHANKLLDFLLAEGWSKFETGNCTGPQMIPGPQIRFKSDTGRNTLQYRGPVIWNFLNRLSENFYS